MLFEQLPEPTHVLLWNRGHIDKLGVADLSKSAVFVQYVGKATAHSGCEVASRLTDNDHSTAGHVFTSVVTNTFDDGRSTTISDSEALSSHAAEECFAARCAIQNRVSDENVLVRSNGRARGVLYGDYAATHSLADVIVGVTFEVQLHTVSDEGAEALPCRALEPELDRAIGQTIRPMASCDLTGEHRPNRPVLVANRHRHLTGFARLERVGAHLDQLLIKGIFKAMILSFGLVYLDIGGGLGSHQYIRKIQTRCLPMRR